MIATETIEFPRRPIGAAAAGDSGSCAYLGASTGAAALSRRKLSLPVDFIADPAHLAWMEHLIAVTDGFVDVRVDFEAGRTTIEYPAPVLVPTLVIART